MFLTQLANLENLIDLTDIINSVLGIIFSVACAFLIPYLKARKVKIEFDTLYGAVKTLTLAAEQIYDGIRGAGEEKKNYVQNLLMKAGFTYDSEKITAIIESAVREMNSLSDQKSKDGGQG